MSILVAKDLSVGYENEILKDINVDVNEAEISVLIGPNGVGKTTLLKTVGGIIPSLSGDIFINGKSISKIKGSEKAKYIATVLTEKSYADYTCEEMVSMGRYPYTNGIGALSQEDKRIVSEAMTLTHIEDISNRSFLKISDGQRQRVLLARAICQRPKLLVLDEPTSFLDVKHKIEFLRLLKKLSVDMEFSVIMSLHELDMAKQIADRIICIKDGHIDKIGSSDDIFSGGYVKKLFDVGDNDLDEKTGLGVLWHTN